MGGDPADDSTHAQNRPDYISPLDDLAFDMYQDPEVAQIIRKLERKKQEAVMRQYFFRRTIPFTQRNLRASTFSVAFGLLCGPHGRIQGGGGKPGELTPNPQKQIANILWPSPLFASQVQKFCAFRVVCQI